MYRAASLLSSSCCQLVFIAVANNSKFNEWWRKKWPNTICVCVCVLLLFLSFIADIMWKLYLLYLCIPCTLNSDHYLNGLTFGTVLHNGDLHGHVSLWNFSARFAAVSNLARNHRYTGKILNELPSQTHPFRRRVDEKVENQPAKRDNPHEMPLNGPNMNMEWYWRIITYTRYPFW